MATLTVAEITADLVGAFRQTNLPLNFFASEFSAEQAVKGQQIIAHVPLMPVASTYDPANGGYANGAQDSKNLLVDVPVTMDQHITVPIKIAHADAISTRSQKYLKTINNAVFVLGKAMIDYALGTATSGNFSLTTVETTANTNRDTLSKVTKAMNTKDTTAASRNGLVTSDFFNALDDDQRIASRDYHGEQRAGDPLGRLHNVAGFTEIVEWPTLPGNGQNLSGFFFDERAIVIATRVPNNTSDIASQLGIPLAAKIEVVKDPESGLTVMAYAWVQNGTLDIYITFTVLFGATAGKRGGAAGAVCDYAGFRVTTA